MYLPVTLSPYEADSATRSAFRELLKSLQDHPDFTVEDIMRRLVAKSHHSPTALWFVRWLTVVEGDCSTMSFWLEVPESTRLNQRGAKEVVVELRTDQEIVRLLCEAAISGRLLTQFKPVAIGEGYATFSELLGDSIRAEAQASSST